jgi:hypothetical protein
VLLNLRLCNDMSRRCHCYLLSLVLVGICIAGSCTPARNPRLEEVQKIWQELPIYPGMTEVEGGMTMSGFDKAHISKHFKSAAAYNEVKRFYEENLTKDRWQFVREDQLKTFGGKLSGGQEVEFRRGEYKLTIEYAPEDLGYGWNYGIGVSWLWKFK